MLPVMRERTGNRVDPGPLSVRHRWASLGEMARPVSCLSHRIRCLTLRESRPNLCPMTTSQPLKPVSTLALAYRNGMNYVLNGQTYASLPKGNGQIYRIAESGQLSPVSEVEADELARMEYLDRITPAQGAREIPTE